MSNEALAWAFRVPVLGVNKAVLVALADHAGDETLSCWPSVARLVLFSGWKERAVRNAIRDLEMAGLIRTEQSRGRATNRYILNVDPALRAELEKSDPAPHAVFKVTNPAPDALQPGTSYRNPACHDANPAPHAPEPSEPILTLIEPPRIQERDPVDEAVGIWNLICGGAGGMVQKITAPRRAALKARLREDFGDDLGRWRSYCETISASAFLTGESDRGWRADFDWALKPANTIKVLEGKYTNRKPKSSGNAIVDWVEQSGYDITKSMDELKEQIANGHEAASSNGSDLGREIVAPDDWWKDTTDEGNHQLVRRDTRR